MTDTAGYRIGGYLFRRRVNIAKLAISANAFMVSRLNDMSGRLLELRFAISSNAGWRHEPVVAGDAGALFIGVLGAELMTFVSDVEKDKSGMEQMMGEAIGRG